MAKPSLQSLFPEPPKDDLVAIARAKSRAQPREATVGPEWPKADNISLEEAIITLTIFMYEQNAKLSVGVGSDGGSIYISLKSPMGGMDEKVPTQAFTASDTLDKAIRKAAQLVEESSSKIWKFDAWAASRIGNPHGVQ